MSTANTNANKKKLNAAVNAVKSNKAKPPAVGAMGRLAEYININSNANTNINTASGYNSNSNSNTDSNTNENFNIRNYPAGWFEDIKMPKMKTTLVPISASSSAESIHDRTTPYWSYNYKGTRPIPIKRTFKTYNTRRYQRRRRDTRRTRK